MAEDLHHVHIFASNFQATLDWWCEMLDAEVVYDGDFGGVRNAFLRIGTGGLNVYDQPPRGESMGPVHHIGVRSDDLPKVVAKMRDRGVEFRSGIREFGQWRYIMCAAPDGVLLELFQADADLEPAAVATYLRGRAGSQEATPPSPEAGGDP
jgi:catechol 2,3-dioxygenase-like lactoylglutathione lyase family enzyme